MMSPFVVLSQLHFVDAAPVGDNLAPGLCFVYATIALSVGRALFVHAYE